jgi:hypothetical protein
MVRHVVDKARAPVAAPAGLRFLVDAYCGGGLFCLSASRHFEVRAGFSSIGVWSVEWWTLDLRGWTAGCVGPRVIDGPDSNQIRTGFDELTTICPAQTL